MDMQLQSLIDEIQSASGKIDADMHMTNLRILDVYTETVYPGAMVIKNGKIVAINPNWTVQAAEVFDGRGMTFQLFAIKFCTRVQHFVKAAVRTRLLAACGGHL